MHGVTRRGWLAAAVGLLGLAASSAQAKDAELARLRAEVDQTLARFKRTDPGIARLLGTAAGYAVFPRIGKGGFVFGGAGGSGLVFEKGALVGRTRMSQVTVGAQIGGQVYSQLILFQNRAALDRFTQSRFEMSAQTSAIVAAEGVSATARYTQGVMVFTLPGTGLMAEASVGGQRFSFTPLAR